MWDLPLALTVVVSLTLFYVAFWVDGEWAEAALHAAGLVAMPLPSGRHALLPITGKVPSPSVPLSWPRRWRAEPTPSSFGGTCPSDNLSPSTSPCRIARPRY